LRVSRPEPPRRSVGDGLAQPTLLAARCRGRKCGGGCFAPVANVVLGSVRPEEEGQASGANNAIRELGGVFGVAVLASIFAQYGAYSSPARFVSGVEPTIWVGAAVFAAGAVVAALIGDTRGLPRATGGTAARGWRRLRCP
jgi:MFS family permease